MIDIVPNWHPVPVHFTIALLSTATGLFLAARAFAGRGWASEALTAARWTLWLGALATLGTVAAGFYAYSTVAHDTASHAAMTNHRNWALPTAAAFLMFAIWSWRDRQRGSAPGGAFLAGIILAAAALAVTGYKGGDVVFRHGLGVMALPETAGAGQGHDHDHDHDHAHEPETAAPEAQDHADADHDHAAPGTAVATLDAFHHALGEGRGTDALALLAEDATIFESGGVEASRAAYAGHHLGADMAFLADISVEVLDRGLREAGDIAVVTSHTRSRGTYEGHGIDLRGTETAILGRGGDGGWRIVHLHWSSRPENSG